MFPWLKKTGEPGYSGLPPSDELAQKLVAGDTSFLGDYIEGKGEDTLEQLVLNGSRFLCTIPYVASSIVENSTASDTSQEERQKELIRASDHGIELLKEMQGQCLYYAAGWWVYSFCYGEGVKQFHPLPHGRGIPTYPPTEDKSVHSFFLGRVSDDRSVSGAVGAGEAKETTSAAQKQVLTPSTQLQTQGETNFLVQKLDGGTICDLTGQQRRIDVQFHCSPTAQDRISIIKETASCVYLMVIHTPRLCNDIVFMPPQVEKPYVITCQEIVDADEVGEWKIRKNTQAASRFGTPEGVPSKQATRLAIGGIVVGGQNLVGGTPDRTIKMSKAMAAAQQAAQQLAAATNMKAAPKSEETYVATLAKSDGTFTSIISEKEMKKHGLQGERKDLQKWIDEITALAGEGVPWKLDVFDTAEGMEFRGIFGEEDSEDEGVAQKKAERKGGKEVEQKTKTMPANDGEVGSQEEYRKKTPLQDQP